MSSAAPALFVTWVDPAGRARLVGWSESAGMTASRWSTCSVVCSIPNRVAEQPLDLAATAVAVLAGVDQHVRGQRREARGDLPDVQVVDVGDAGETAGSRCSMARRVEPARGGLEQHACAVAEQARTPALAISAATTSAAIASARPKPVVSTTRPATRVATNANRSLSTCWKAPSTFRLRRSARRSSQVAREVDQRSRPRP